MPTQKIIQLDVIDSFSGEYAFLSSFYPVFLRFGGMTVPNVEYGYQMAKCADPKDYILFLGRGPGQAKRMGGKIVRGEPIKDRIVPLRADWFDPGVREEVMYALDRQKYFKHPELGDRLIATHPKRLIEGNTWKDTFWGVYEGKGENKKGEIAMRLRRELREQRGLM